MVNKRQIRVSEALRDLRSGMTESRLMDKYRLDAQGLKSLFTKLVKAGLVSTWELDNRIPGFLSETELLQNTLDGTCDLVKRDRLLTGARPVNAKEAVADVRSGMDDSALMDKYRLTANGLQDLLDKLIAARLLEPAELDGRRGLRTSTVDLKAATNAVERFQPAEPEENDNDSGQFLLYPVPIFDADSPSVFGQVRRLSENSLGTMGISTKTGDRRTLIVCPEGFFTMERFGFETVCRSASGPGSLQQASFEITRIEDEAADRLKELIGLLTFS